MTRILVTGYGGFLGSAIARQLLEKGFQVRGLARSRYERLAEQGVECIQGSVADREVADKACKDCDAIVHTAAQAGIWGPWSSYYTNNTLATSHLLEAAHRNRISTFVYTSSPSVTFDGRPQSGVDESVPYPTKWLCHYPQSKALAEKDVLSCIERGGIRGCVLRPHLIWGEKDPHLFPRVIERTLSGRLRRVGSGQNLIDVVHVDHAAWAHVSALEKLLDADQGVNGKAMFLSDGDPIACWNWLTQILETAGVDAPKRSISFSAAYRLGAVLEAGYKILRKQQEPPMTRFVAAQLALDHYFDISCARQALDYQPWIDRNEALAKCEPWLTGIAKSFSRG